MLSNGQLYFEFRNERAIKERDIVLRWPEED